MRFGIQHYLQAHKKKRHKTRWKNVLDSGVYFFGAISIILTIPQVTKIFNEKNASGISMISWFAYLASAIFWIAYGQVHKAKSIVFINIIWIILDLLIILGIFLYGQGY